RAPVILSKAAVEKIRFKFGQVQAQANSGALFLSKPLKCNSNSSAKPATTENNAAPVAAQKTVKPASIAMPTPMPLPLATATPTATPTPQSAPVALNPTTTAMLPELKISALPAAVSFNGAKLLKVQGGALAVVMPALAPAPATATTAVTATATNSCSSQAIGSPNKLQRSKSLAGNTEAATAAAEASTQSNAAERRHSVAIMSKEVDVVEQPIAIETITIDDDDDEDEVELQPNLPQQQQEPQQQQQQLLSTPSAQTSRKSSTASRSSIASVASSNLTSSSSSSLEMIVLPAVVPKSDQQPEQQPEREQPEKQPLEQPLEQPAKISIVKAETLSVSKEDFEKSLHCPEQVEQNSPPCAAPNRVPKPATTGSISLTPIARLLHHAKDQQSAEKAVEQNVNYKRNMQLNYSMLRWRDQQSPSTLHNSNMRFALNHFNLLQLSERCEPRQAPVAYFDRALFDRPARRPTSSSHPLLYLCSRCNCHGPASDFLAPRFCSICCVRRAHKRRQPNAPNSASDSKAAKLTNGHAPHQQQQPPQQQQQQQHNKQQQLKQQQQQQQRERDRKRGERKSMPVKRPFRWTEYLKLKGTGPAAPIHLFLNPFPITPNCFERGMKLEAIDPENCSLFCVCTIVEVRGYRLKLNFDGYASMYDFWVNADSMDIFPPGWCERTSHILQAPKGYCPDRFTWYRYLVKTNAKAAPTALFTHLNGPSQTRINGFQVGMHLEAEDLNDTGKICVATVADILDERIRVHFDGWDDCYDFWVHVNSPYIHPCSWHEGRQQLIVPPDYQNLVFNWADYIAEVGGTAAPVELFAPREPMEFQPRMKLEVVDQRNPCLIRPATVITRKGYRVQLHLDCWPTEYYFWLEDDSPDLHPIGWCEATSHELETPPGFLQRPSPMPCDVEGCRGFGNAKRFNLNVHALRDCCPYAPENWRQWRAKTVKPPRVLPEHIKQSNNSKPKESSPLLLSRLSHTKPSVVKSQVKVEKAPTRRSLDAEPPKPKIKREEQKPVQVKKEPVTAKRETAKVTPLCLSLAKPIVADYGPQLQRNYHLWQRNSDFDLAQVKTNPLYWTNWDVYEFVERALKSSSIAQQLFDEEIDGRALLMMGRNDLATYFKLKVGPTVKLFSLIVNLRIAVACKFKTTRFGLNINRARFPLPATNNSNTVSKQEVVDNHSVSSPNSMEQDEQDELTDEEDVILDSDDFLSVKP
ncbi:hypothetical protein KR044_003517, partial [Drosophila immigrans]